MRKKPEAYPPRYTEDFFARSAFIASHIVKLALKLFLRPVLMNIRLWSVRNSYRLPFVTIWCYMSTELRLVAAVADCFKFRSGSSSVG